MILAVAVLLAVVLKAFFVEAFYIPSPSMQPLLVKDDKILVQKVSYWFGGEPQRGDIVVFQDPGGWLTDAEAAGPDNPVAKAMAAVGLYPEGGHLVKRVIGVAGDTISCCDDKGRISVNGQPLDEDSYIREQGIRCNVICPGWVDTEMSREGIEGLARETGTSYEEALKGALGAVPLARMSSPAEVAGVVAWLLSSDAATVTGQGIDVNGGAWLG